MNGMSEKKIKVGIAPLGCCKNQVDAEIMLHKLVEAGYEITPYEAEADVIIINTCGFIESAKQEAIEAIFEAHEYKKAGSLKALVVTGCLAERYPDQLAEEMPEVDGIVTLGCNGDIVSVLDRLLEDSDETERQFKAPKENLPLEGERLIINEPYFAYIKIAEGCNNHCTYCAIPSIRGALRSRPMESVVAEAEGLAKKGVKELVVVAQDTTRYGEDLYGESRLSALLCRLNEIEGLRWIRVMYAYPDSITEELLDTMASCRKVVPYLDLPIQHCNSEILRRMNRRGSKEQLEETVALIRRKLPRAVIRTTLITGFPGETEEEFEELCEFVKEMKFDRLGCFAFSPEEGTAAAEMDGQIEEEERLRRQDIVMREQAAVAEALSESWVGRVVTVLVEGYDPGVKHYFGRTEADAPEVDGKIFFPSSRKLEAGEFTKVRVTDWLDYDLIGEPV